MMSYYVILLHIHYSSITKNKVYSLNKSQENILIIEYSQTKNTLYIPILLIEITSIVNKTNNCKIILIVTL